MGISVLILTLNEELNLPACLASVAWSDDIVVLDSFSTDNTVAIAEAAGARVVQHEFVDEPSQRRYGLKEISFKHPWVYVPDADEVTPPELSDEMLAVTADPDRPEGGFRCRFKVFFMGRWIRHSSLYPTWVVRLVRPDRIEFEREVNCHWIIQGAEGRLENHFIHYSFNKGISWWFEKHNRYSWHEARESLNSLTAEHLDWRGMVGHGDAVRRRRALKAMSFRLPNRPFLRFLYMYFVRRGFLDGWPGYLYCRLLASYELMIVVKMAEIRRRRQGLPV
ncbi:MAG: glycosyltransferase family 2 protein [Rhodospirillales bacterium]|nr:glycosyltransferase family 2 protein [Rhodospirillales bacterium]